MIIMIIKNIKCNHHKTFKKIAFVNAKCFVWISFLKKNLKKYTRISSSSFHASTPKISGLAMDSYDNKKL